MATTNPYFSVIIPTYNRAHLLQSIVERVQQQTYSHWELIIVDDGSTDNTKLTVEPLLVDTRISYHVKPNAGVSAARNFGSRNASGIYLVFLDTDDEPYRNWLEGFVSIDRKPILFAAYDEYQDGLKVRTNTTFEASPLTYGQPAMFLSGTFAVEKILFIEAGGYDELLKYGENAELGIRLMHRVSSRQESAGYNYTPAIRLNFDNVKDRANKYLVARIESIQRTMDVHAALFNDHPNQKRLYLSILGYCYRMRKDFAKAAKVYHKLCILNPFSIRYLFLYLFCAVKK